MTEISRDQSPVSSITDVLADLQTISRWQEHVYKQLHAHPELSFQESKTAELAASKLQELGYEILEGMGQTGVVGVLRNGEGQTVLARADMDALPVKENTGLPYASTVTAADDKGETVSVAHACGHDAHVACLLGAAELLANSRRSWGGTFIALFQPAEEVAGGAKAMVADGLRERIPKPDVAFAQHVLAHPAGTIGTSFWSMGSWGGSGVAALFGGLVASSLGWRWIFWISIIVAVLSFLLIRGTPESKVESNQDHRFDWSGIYKMASSLGAAFGVAISAALFTALSELDTSFTAMSDLFLGRTDNVAIRFAASIALLFNVLMVVIAIIAIIMTVPQGEVATRGT